jgi:HK97 family phage portal protein
VWGNPPPGSLELWPVPPAVTRATSLICDTIAGLPWQVRRGREPVEVPTWIEDPQARRRDLRIYGGPLPQWRLSPVEFRSKSIKSMLWKGESIWYVPERDAAGNPAPPIWQLNPDMIEIDGSEYVIPEGQPVDPRLADEDGATSDEYRFSDGELIVIRGMMGDGLRGIGVLEAHLRELMLAGQIGEFAWNMLRSGIPNGYLKVNSPNITDVQARKLQRDWMSRHGGARKAIAVLNATTEFHDLQLNPQSMQLAQMRDFGILDWALVFGIPPWFLGVTTARDTYSNVESRFIELGQFTLLPWTRRMESGVDAELPRGTDLKINLSGLMRPDTLARYQAHRIALTEPAFMTVDEVRELEDRPPMPAELDIEAAEAEAAQARLRMLPGGGA